MDRKALPLPVPVLRGHPDHRLGLGWVDGWVDGGWGDGRVDGRVCVITIIIIFIIIIIITIDNSIAHPRGNGRPRRGGAWRGWTS